MSGNRSLAANAAYSVIYKLLNVLFPLITVIYASRILNADGMGRVAYAQNIVQYFVLVAALGIPTYGVRRVSQIRADQAELDRTFSELFIINAISTLLCCIAYYSLILCSDLFAQHRMLFSVTGISLVLNFINVDWFYQGEEEFRYIAVRNFVVKLGALVLLVLLVRNKEDYVAYAFISSLAIAGNYMFNVLKLRGRIHFVREGLSLGRHVRPVMLLLASTIAIELYTLLDTTMLGVLCSESVVGWYSSAVKIARGLNMGITAMSAVLLPRLSYYLSSGEKNELDAVANRALRMIMLISFPATVELFLFADDVVLICFGESFAPAIVSLRFLAVLCTAVSLNNFFGTQILLTFGREMNLLVSVVCGAIVNIVLNIALIPMFANDGAAFASAVSEVCVMVLAYLFARRYINFGISRRFWGTVACSLILMLITAIAIRCLGLGNIPELATGIIVSLLIYAACSYGLKNEAAQELVGIISRQLKRR